MILKTSWAHPFTRVGTNSEFLDGFLTSNTYIPWRKNSYRTNGYS
jgi:hypothetical protein